MIPPTSIDGTDITGATIDGTDVQEITVDGQTVFSAVGDAFAPNPLVQYPMDEGSGSTISDAFAQEPDGTFSGPTFISDSDLVGGFGVDFDGSNDEINLTNPAYLQTPFTVTILVTVELDSIANDQTFFNLISDSGLVVALGTSVSNNGELATRNQSGSVSLSGALSISTKHRVGAVYKSSSTSEIIIDGVKNQDGTNTCRAGGPSVLGNRDDSSQGDFTMDGRLDNFVVYDRELNASEIQADFDAQPWTP